MLNPQLAEEGTASVSWEGWEMGGPGYLGKVSFKQKFLYGSDPLLPHHPAVSSCPGHADQKTRSLLSGLQGNPWWGCPLASWESSKQSQAGFWIPGCKSPERKTRGSL
jgi:hypothetical protein